jgi:hypothetical protein
MGTVTLREGKVVMVDLLSPQQYEQRKERQRKKEIEEEVFRQTTENIPVQPSRPTPPQVRVPTSTQPTADILVRRLCLVELYIVNAKLRPQDASVLRNTVVLKLRSVKMATETVESWYKNPSSWVAEHAITMQEMSAKVESFAKQLPSNVATMPHPSRVPSVVRGRVQLAPDGTYVGGIPHMAPDGIYVGGTPRLAPDGTYVGGRPRMAPDGTYVNGTPHLAPDGTYVGGKPLLAPNGKYVGTGEED